MLARWRRARTTGTALSDLIALRFDAWSLLLCASPTRQDFADQHPDVPRLATFWLPLRGRSQTKTVTHPFSPSVKTPFPHSLWSGDG